MSLDWLKSSDFILPLVYKIGFNKESEIFRQVIKYLEKLIELLRMFQNFLDQSIKNHTVNGVSKIPIK